jgi:L-lactate permease
VALPIQALRGNGEANAGCGFTERRRRAMLSERDKLQLKAIEHRLALNDPEFAMIMRGVISRRIDWREVRRAVAYVALAVWLVVLTVTTAVQSWLASELCAIVGSAAVLVVIAIRTNFRRRRA